MKIIIINGSYKQGSTGKIVDDLYLGYKSEGHDVRVCCASTEEQGGDIYAISTSKKIFIDVIFTLFSGLVGYGNMFATRKLLKYIAQFQPDIVHLHNIHGYYLNINMLLKYLKRHSITTVHTLHDECAFTGKCGHAYNCDGFTKTCGNCPELRSYPKSKTFDFTKKMLKDKKRIYKDFDSLIIVTVSKWLSDRVAISILKDKKKYVVHNGINTDIFHHYKTNELRNYHNLENKKVLMHTTASFVDPKKGGKYILELAKRMPDVTFILAGNQEEISVKTSNVIVLGIVKNQIELAKYYSMADASIIASERETFSMVCAESLCCGTPIVGFNAGAPLEVAPKNYGRFVPFGDIDALEKVARQAINGELEGKIECEKFGKEYYDRRVMACNYLKVFQEVKEL